MIEANKKNVSVFIQPTKLTGDVVVCVSFKLDVNSCCLNRLESGWHCDCYPSGIEETCVAHAVYLNVNNALCGDPVAMKATKVSNTRCGANNGHFFISWHVKGTTSAIRKSLGLAFKAMVPAKLKPVYKRHVQSLGGKFNDNEFNWAADKVSKSIDSGIHCGVVGNVKADQAKLNDALEVIVKKLSNPAVDGTKTKPSNHKECNHEDVSEVKVSGWTSYVVRDLIMSKARGVIPLVCNKSLLIPMKSNLWETLSGKLKEQSAEFIKSRYEKAGDELGSIIAYLAMSNGVVSCVDVKSLLKNKPSGASIVADVKKAL